MTLAVGLGRKATKQKNKNKNKTLSSGIESFAQMYIVYVSNYSFYETLSHDLIHLNLFIYSSWLEEKKKPKRPFINHQACTNIIEYGKYLKLKVIYPHFGF